MFSSKTHLFTWTFCGNSISTREASVAIISDVQAILDNMFISVLVRQLLRAYPEQCKIMAKLFLSSREGWGQVFLVVLLTYTNRNTSLSVRSSRLSMYRALLLGACFFAQVFGILSTVN